MNENADVFTKADSECSALVWLAGVAFPDVPSLIGTLSLESVGSTCVQLTSERGFSLVIFLFQSSIRVVESSCAA